jgi:hypothetical protein
MVGEVVKEKLIYMLSALILEVRKKRFLKSHIKVQEQNLLKIRLLLLGLK